MRNRTSYLTIAVFPLLFYFCAHRLTGTWHIQKYETVSPSKRGVSIQNAGTITFDKDGTGQKNLNYTILGIEKIIVPLLSGRPPKILSLEKEKIQRLPKHGYMLKTS